MIERLRECRQKKNIIRKDESSVLKKKERFKMEKTKIYIIKLISITTVKDKLYKTELIF